jgi:hypothetical protein
MNKKKLEAALTDKITSDCMSILQVSKDFELLTDIDVFTMQCNIMVRLFCFVLLSADVKGVDDVDDFQSTFFEQVKLTIQLFRDTKTNLHS